jgi:hypothetical protein
LSEIRCNTLRQSGEISGPHYCGPAAKRVPCTAPPEQKHDSVLLDPRAATLDQNDQDDDKHAGNNPNDRGAVHVDSSFLND